jgi:hypothetical protein
MDEAKRKRLEQKGWKVGNVSEFLEFTKEETALIETTKISEFFRQSPLAELTEELDLNRDQRYLGSFVVLEFFVVHHVNLLN